MKRYVSGLKLLVSPIWKQHTWFLLILGQTFRAQSEIKTDGFVERLRLEEQRDWHHLQYVSAPFAPSCSLPLLLHLFGSKGTGSICVQAQTGFPPLQAFIFLSDD